MHNSPSELAAVMQGMSSLHLKVHVVNIEHYLEFSQISKNYEYMLYN